MEDAHKAEAPRMGEAPWVGDGAPFWSKASRLPVKRANTRWRPRAFLKAAYKAMDRFERAKETGFSATSRLMDMDEQGVDVQILYPTYTGQMLGREFRDTKLLAACCRAYNNWAAGLHLRSARTSSAGPRPLPMQEPEEAIKEAERARGQRLRELLYATPTRSVAARYGMRDYHPLWATIERLGKPISTHDSASASVPSFGDRMDTHTSGHILSHPFEAMAAMAGLIWFGIFEKFPQLKVIHVEGDGGWTPYWLQRMEQHREFSGNAEHEYLTRPPTEYFSQQCMRGFPGRTNPTMKSAV